jgi:hypothetical protein
MNRSAFVAVGLAGALALAAAPASAQHRRGGESGDNAAPRGERRQAQQAQPQQREQRQEQRAQPRQEQRAEPRQEQRALPRQEQRAQPREEQRAQPRQENREQQRAVPRQEYRGGQQYSGSRYAAPRNYYSGRYYGSRYAGPRFYSSPRRFYRPYYVFRPRFSLGFGIWSGFPVTYYDPYYYPYDYSPSYSTGPGYPPPQGSVNVQPYAQQNQGNMGGLSFDISPDSAEIYVDGNYAGAVGQFTSSSQPLGLPAGRHHIELREPGYNVSSFDVDIIAGQVIPYQGQLQQ